MARGQRKTIEEKITAEEVAEVLQQYLESREAAAS